MKSSWNYSHLNKQSYIDLQVWYNLCALNIMRNRYYIQSFYTTFDKCMDVQFKRHDRNKKNSKIQKIQLISQSSGKKNFGYQRICQDCAHPLSDLYRYIQYDTQSTYV